MFTYNIVFLFENMGFLGQIVDVLKRQAISDVQATCVRLSYIDKLLPELKNEEYVILHKRIPSSHNPQDSFNSTMHTAELETSQSTLKYTCSTFNYDNMVVSPICNWDKIDENYHPLSRTDASIVLNLCLECLKCKCTKPLIVLCNGKDKHKTRLLGAIVKDGWFNAIEGCFVGIQTLCTLKNCLSDLWNEHLMLSQVPEYQVKVSTLSIFNVVGEKYDMSNWNLISQNDFGGHLCIEVDGNSLSWDTSPMTSKHNLVIEIMVGWSNSPLKGLWEQLILLHQYLSIIEKHNEQLHILKHNNVHLNIPNFFATPYKKEYQDVLKNINMLLCGDYSYIQIDTLCTQNQELPNSFNQKNVKNCDITLHTILKEIFSKKNISFTDLLWDELVSTPDYIQMTNCLRIVLREFASNVHNTQTHISSTARIGKIIPKLKENPGVIENLLTGCIPLELVIDMGFEKLNRHYKHILTSAQFINVLDPPRIFNTTSSEEFATENYAKKLNTLLKIHICLEFIVFVQMKLNIPLNNLQTMFERCHKKFFCDETINRDIFDKPQNRVYKLTESINGMVLKNDHRGTPVSKRIILSSSAGLSRVKTITYHSQSPIFPVTIFPTDELKTEEEKFHMIKIVHSSLRIK